MIGLLEEGLRRADRLSQKIEVVDSHSRESSVRLSRTVDKADKSSRCQKEKISTKIYYKKAFRVKIKIL